MVSAESGSRVLYLIDEVPTMTFVERLIQKAVEPSTAVGKNFGPDAAAMRELLERVAALQRADFECQVACARPDAVNQVIASSPTLIILDVVRYNRSMRRLQRDLKQHPATRGIPLIIVTADARPRLRARAAAIGCESYLVKPALAGHLYAEIRRIGIVTSVSFG